jgi:hypothetical protein
MSEIEEFDEKLEEPVLSAEETLEAEIAEQTDAEQVRVHSLTEPGTPMKYIVYRSKKLNKQVVSTPEYFALTDGVGKDKQIIGLQRWGEKKAIQNYGVENKLDKCTVIGERKRGE